MPRTAKTTPDAAFPYLRPEALIFLRNLAKHNDREWFTPRKAVFEAELKEPMLAIVDMTLWSRLSQYFPA